MKRMFVALVLLFNAVAIYAQGVVEPKEDWDNVSDLERAAKKGAAIAQLKYGDYFLKEKADAKQAFQWYMKSANQGNAEAQFKVSDMYRFGTGVKKDNKKKEEWLTRSANNGYARAQYKLGRDFANGSNVSGSADKAKAGFLIRRAAQQDYAPAQFFFRGNLLSTF